MGLDMYLKGRRNCYDLDSSTPELQSIKSLMPESEPFAISSIEYRLGYWRKANAIHRWFVDNVQEGRDECQESWVSIEDLERLLDIIDKVLAEHTLAEELLPTSSGFFFGNTDYDDGYFQDLEYTKQIIEPIVQDQRFSQWSIYYQASW